MSRIPLNPAELAAVNRLKPVLVWEHGDRCQLSCGTSWLCLQQDEEVLLRLSGDAALARFGHLLGRSIINLSNQDYFPQVSDENVLFSRGASWLQIGHRRLPDSQKFSELVIGGRNYQTVLDRLLDLRNWLELLQGRPSPLLPGHDGWQLSVQTDYGGTVLKWDSLLGERPFCLAIAASRQLQGLLLLAASGGISERQKIVTGSGCGLAFWPGGFDNWPSLGLISDGVLIKQVNLGGCDLVRLAGQIEAALDGK